MVSVPFESDHLASEPHFPSSAETENPVGNENSEPNAIVAAVTTRANLDFNFMLITNPFQWDVFPYFVPLSNDIIPLVYSIVNRFCARLDTSTTIRYTICLFLHYISKRKTDASKSIGFFVLRLISLVGISAASKGTSFHTESKSQADEIRTYAYVLLQTSSCA